jgi:hypothetical protein
MFYGMVLISIFCSRAIFVDFSFGVLWKYINVRRTLSFIHITVGSPENRVPGRDSNR